MKWTTNEGGSCSSFCHGYLFTRLVVEPFCSKFIAQFEAFAREDWIQLVAASEACHDSVASARRRSDQRQPQETSQIGPPQRRCWCNTGVAGEGEFMNDSGQFQDAESNYSGKFSHVHSQSFQEGRRETF